LRNGGVFGVAVVQRRSC